MTDHTHDNDDNKPHAPGSDLEAPTLKLQAETSTPQVETRGRPTKLNPERAAKFCELLREGNYLDTAAYASGVHPSTIYNWLDAGAVAKKGAHHSFFDEVKKAAAYAEVEALRTAKAGKFGWQSAAWFLERRYPAKYARREYIQDARDVKEIPQDELDRLVAEALEVKRPHLIGKGSTL